MEVPLRASLKSSLKASGEIWGHKNKFYLKSESISKQENSKVRFIKEPESFVSEGRRKSLTCFCVFDLKHGDDFLPSTFMQYSWFLKILFLLGKKTNIHTNNAHNTMSDFRVAGKVKVKIYQNYY